MKNIEINDLTKSISKKQLEYKKFRSRVKTTYDDGKRKQQIIINLRMEKSKSIWMSANMIVPIAKLLITPDKVSFYEKFKKLFLRVMFLLSTDSLIPVLNLKIFKIY